MRRLLLVRHAKAADGSPDRDRPLAPSGRQAAVAIGRWIIAQHVTVDHAAVSPARRTMQTWQLAGAPVPPVPDERIYDNRFDDLIAVIRATPREVSTLALVGHNPSILALSAALGDQGDQGDPAAAGRTFVDGFPTGGVALFDVPVEWADVDSGSARLAVFARPR